MLKKKWFRFYREHLEFRRNVEISLKFAIKLQSFFTCKWHKNEDTKPIWSFQPLNYNKVLFFFFLFFLSLIGPVTQNLLLVYLWFGMDWGKPRASYLEKRTLRFVSKYTCLCAHIMKVFTTLPIPAVAFKETTNSTSPPPPYSLQIFSREDSLNSPNRL